MAARLRANLEDADGLCTRTGTTGRVPAGSGGGCGVRGHGGGGLLGGFGSRGCGRRGGLGVGEMVVI